MIAAFLLAGLAVVDSGFCGFREAAGKDRRIEKRPYYRRAIRRGMAFGVVLVIVFGAAIAAAVHFSQGLWPDLLSAAARMVLVYGAYATMVLLALGVYAVSSGDLRTLATVSVLGPFTLIRPLVISAGGVWGAIGASQAATAAIVCAAAGAMIGFEPMLRARSGRTVQTP